MKPPAKPKHGLPGLQRGPVTRERIEGALDALAEIIASRSPEDAAALAPIYERLERELAAFGVQARVRARSTSDAIAYPPRGLSREAAARYVGVGITKFDEMVADGRMPKPKRIDGRVIWDRLRIDAAFTDLPEDRAALNPLDRILPR